MVLRKDPGKPRPSGSVLRVDERAIADIVTAVDAHLPLMMNYFADLIGRAAPRVSARERQSFMRGLKRKMQRLVPVFAELEANRGIPDPAEKINSVKATRARSPY